MTWLEKMLLWLFNALPLNRLLHLLVDFLREQAKKTETKVDDMIVDFIESALKSMHLLDDS